MSPTLQRGRLFVMLLLGVIGLARFAPRVRSVDAVGLFASGALAGGALVRIMRRD